jgi:hypothetical protein
MSTGPSWLAAVKTSLRHLFEAGSTTHDKCQLMAGDADPLVMVRAAGLACRHEKVEVYRLAGMPDYDGPPVAYLFGTAESVAKFMRTAHSAGALIPGTPPNLFGIAWIAFVLQRLRSIPTQVLRARSAAENTDCDQAMVNPFLASLLVIDSVTGAKQSDQEPPLGERRYDVLDALYDLKAFTPDARTTTASVAERLGVDPAALKEPVSDLAGHELLATKKGRAGGVWLTQDGREFVERQRKR